MKKYLLLVLTVLGVLSGGILRAQINSNSPKVPFGSHTSYKYGIMPTTLPTGGTYGSSSDAATAYNEWKSNFVVDCSIGARVKFTPESDRTVSEGIAYGMLLSAYAGDKPLFDKLWAYYRNNGNGVGIMNWLIQGCGKDVGPNGSNGATDAELDAAHALIIASEQWPNASSPYTYKSEASYLIGKIKEYEIAKDGTYQTLNGDAWNSTCRNPSYQAPAYYKEFAEFDAANAAFWGSVRGMSNDMLAGNMNQSSGLVSNWCNNYAPYAANSCGPTPNEYGADACRNPWRTATDYLWYGDDAVSASKSINSKLANFITGNESEMRGPLQQSASNPRGGANKNGSYTTFALPPMTQAAKQSVLDKCYSSAAGLGTESNYYFNSTIRCISLFMLTGNFWVYGTSGQKFPPLFSTGTTNETGDKITITFDKEMGSTSETSSFTLYINGSAKTGAFASIVKNGTKSYDLTLSNGVTIIPGDVLTLSYTPGTIAASDGAALNAFSGKTVKNNLAGNSTLLDDCDDGDSVNMMLGKWFSYNDNKDGGQSEVAPDSKIAGFPMTEGGANGSAYAARIDYVFDKGSFAYDPYVGLGTWADPDTLKFADWSGATGISFWYKGDTCSLQFVTYEGLHNKPDGTTDYAFWSVTVDASKEWKKYSFTWDKFTRPQWAESTDYPLLQSKVQKLQWQSQGKTGMQDYFMVDDVVIEGLVPKCTKPTVSIDATATSVCAGGEVTLTAKGATSYEWSTGAKTAEIKVSPNDATTYTVTGSTASGACSNTASQAITIKEGPTVTIETLTPEICSGSKATLTASGADTYEWSTSATGASIEVSPTAETTYSVTGTTDGCTGSDSQVISIAAGLTVSIETLTPTVCSGATATLTATGATSYEWSTGSTESSIDVNPTVATTYTVTGTTGGCTGEASKEIGISAGLTITIDATSAEICAGDSTTLTASGATAFEWTDGQKTSSIKVSPAAVQSYSVTGSDASGCTGTATKEIAVNALPVVQATASPAVICVGSSSLIEATGAISYAWNNSVTEASQSVNPSVETSYTVTGTDAKGCKDTSVVTVSIAPGLSVSIESVKNSVCSGDSLLLTATGATDYSWDNGAKTASIYATPTAAITYSVTGTSGTCTGTASKEITVDAAPVVVASSSADTVCAGAEVVISASGADTYKWNNDIADASQKVNPTIATSYIVTGTNLAGCKSTDTVSIAINSSFQISLEASSLNVCPGGKTTLKASGAANYVWSTADITDTIEVSPSEKTTYSVVGDNGAGCSDEASIEISVFVPATITATASDNGKICSGDSVTLSASGADAYTWSNDSTGATVVAAPLTTSTFTVSATDNNACLSTATVTVTVTTKPTVTIIASEDSVCLGNKVTIEATGAASYKWSNDATDASIEVSPLTGQSYTVTATSGACEIVKSTDIVVKQPSRSTIDTVVCGSFAYKGTVYSKTTITDVPLVNSVGCDSIVTLKITVNHPTDTLIKASTCGTYTINNTEYSKTNVYTQIIDNVLGCDSTITIDLTVNKASINELSAIQSTSYTLNDSVYTKSGDYYQVKTNSVGCDSTIILHLTISSLPDDTTITACNKWSFNGEPFIESGDYVRTVEGKEINIHLTINKSSENIIFDTACVSYTYGKDVYTKSGSYEYPFTNAAGCDSIVTLNLTIKKSEVGVENVVSCGSYTFHGNTFNESGSYPVTLVAANGCDSVVTLNLVINRVSPVAKTAIACGSYAFDGKVLTKSGIYTSETLKSADGCDSVVTLTLTINNPSAKEITTTERISYVLNDSTYTKTGVYTQTLKNKVGCDSVITLNLTILDLTGLSTAISVANDTLTKAKVGDKTGEHPQSAKDLLIAAVAQAEATLSTATSQEAINTATSALESAISAFIINVNSSNPLDKTALLLAITVANDTLAKAKVSDKPGEHPQSAKDLLVAAIASAQESASVASTQTAINEAATTLNDAITTFRNTLNNVVVADKTALLESIRIANEFLNNPAIGDAPGQYPKASYDALGDAKDKAVLVANNTEATEQAVSSAKSDMDAAIAAFTATKIGRSDFSALSALITSANTKAINATPGIENGNYPATAIENLKTAVLNAKAAEADTMASQSKVDNAVLTLTNAVAAFEATRVGEADKTDLIAVISTANGLLSTATIGQNPGNYPQEVASALTNAVASAQTVVENTSASYSQVNEQISILTNAINTFKANVVGQPNKSQLSAEILTAETKASTSSIGTGANQYPQSAKDELLVAISLARSVLNDNTKSQVEVNNAIVALQNAESTFERSKNTSGDFTVLNATILKAQQTANTDNVGDRPGNYPQSAINSLKAAINTAQLTQLKTNSSQLEIDAASEKLTAALSQFIVSMVGQPNKTDLATSISNANAKVSSVIVGDRPGQYPQSAVDQLNVSRTQANAIYTSTSSSQSEVDLAAQNLNAALSSFLQYEVPVTDKSAIIAEIEKCQSLLSISFEGVSPNQYLPGSKAILAAEVAIASEASLDNTLTKTEVAQVIIELKNAKAAFLNKMVKIGDYTVLESSIATATDLLAQAQVGEGPFMYSQKSVDLLKAAKNSAMNVVSIESTQEEIDNEDLALQTAIDVFVKSQLPDVDRTELRAEITKGKNLEKKTDLSKYPEDVYNEYYAAFDNAVMVNNDPKSSQAKINQATEELSDAIYLVLSHSNTNLNPSSISFNVGPNPFSDVIYGTSSKMIVSVHLRNITNIFMFECQVNSNSFEINTADYSPGIYILTLVFADGSVVCKELVK